MHHDWQISIDQAREIQNELASRIEYTKIPSSISQVAGFDVSYQKEQNIQIAGMVVLDYPSLALLASYTTKARISFPYVPGFLSFREAPALLKLISKHARQVDLFIFDGHGRAHPRGLGIASHIGVITGKPSIGCAKKRLVGEFAMPENHKGAVSQLKYRGKIVGSVLRTRQNVKPVFVSVGNRVRLPEAVEFILSCTPKYRLPEPTRLAHLCVTKAKLN